VRPSRRSSTRAAGDAVAERVDDCGHGGATGGPVGVPVGGDHPSHDPPGGLDLDVVVIGEQEHEPFALPVGEQVLAGVQGPARPVQRVAGQAPVTVELLLDPAPAGVHRVPAEADDVEGVHHRDRGWELLGGGGLEPGEPVHRNHLHSVAPILRPPGEPRLERRLGT